MLMDEEFVPKIRDYRNTVPSDQILTQSPEMDGGALIVYMQ